MPPARTGKLSLTSDLPRAAFSVDGVERTHDVAHVELELPEGPHPVVVRGPGGQRWETVAVVRAEATTTVRAQLSPAPAAGEVPLRTRHARPVRATAPSPLDDRRPVRVTF